MDRSITPIRNYINKEGSWIVEFKEEEIKELFNKFNQNKELIDTIDTCIRMVDVLANYNFSNTIVSINKIELTKNLEEIKLILIDKDNG